MATAAVTPRSNDIKDILLQGVARTCSDEVKTEKKYIINKEKETIRGFQSNKTAAEALFSYWFVVILALLPC